MKQSFYFCNHLKFHHACQGTRETAYIMPSALLIKYFPCYSVPYRLVIIFNYKLNHNVLSYSVDLSVIFVLSLIDLNHSLLVLQLNLTAHFVLT